MATSMEAENAMSTPMQTPQQNAAAPVWQWKDGKVWIDYDASTSAQLETAHVDGTKQLVISIPQGGTTKSYKISLTMMRQENIETNFKRPIRRVGAA